MFNDDRKILYITEKRSSTIVPSNFLKRQFKNISKYEEKLDKDLCDFVLEEIIHYYKEIKSTSLESLAVLNSHFSMYTQWCIQNGLSNNYDNNYTNINLDVMNECVDRELLQKKIVDRAQVVRWCEQLANPKDQVAMLGIFEGLKGKNFTDLTYLREQDIRGNTATLHDGREITISGRLIGYIFSAIKEDIYYSMSEKQTKTMTLIGSGYVIKSYPNANLDANDFYKGRTIYNGISRCLKYLGVEKYTSANSINESGKIYMIKKRANELNVSCEEYVYSDYIKEIEHRFGCKIARSTFWMKYQEYLK